MSNDIERFRVSDVPSTFDREVGEVRDTFEGRAEIGCEFREERNDRGGRRGGNEVV